MITLSEYNSKINPSKERSIIGTSSIPCPKIDTCNIHEIKSE